MSSKISDSILKTDGIVGTNSGIKYKLLEIGGSMSDEGWQATEKVIIQSSDLKAFIQEAMPPPIFQFDIAFRPPRRRMPGAPWMRLKSIQFEQWDKEKPVDMFGAYGSLVDAEGEKVVGVDVNGNDVLDGRTAASTFGDFVQLTLSYETAKDTGEDKDGNDENKEDPDDPKTFLEHSITAGGQFLSIPPANTKVKHSDVNGKSNVFDSGKNDYRPADEVKSSDDAGNPVTGLTAKSNKNQQMPIVWTIPKVEHTLKWSLVRNPNWEKIYSLLGKVNDRPLLLFDLAPTETVMFTGVSGSQRYLWDGANSRVQPWSLDFKFSQRQINFGGEPAVEADPAKGVAAVAEKPARTFGWNHDFDPVQGEWVEVFLANGKKRFDQANFLDMFKRSR